MAYVDLKEDEFIIKLGNKDVADVFMQKEAPLLQLVNPHKSGEFSSNHYQAIKMILDVLGSNTQLRTKTDG